MSEDDLEATGDSIIHDAFFGAETAEEALGVLAFAADAPLDTILQNICFNVHEYVARITLTGLLQGMVANGEAQKALLLVEAMTLMEQDINPT